MIPVLDFHLLDLFVSYQRQALLSTERFTQSMQVYSSCGKVDTCFRKLQHSATWILLSSYCVSLGSWCWVIRRLKNQPSGSQILCWFTVYTVVMGSEQFKLYEFYGFYGSNVTLGYISWATSVISSVRRCCDSGLRYLPIEKGKF